MRKSIIAGAIAMVSVSSAFADPYLKAEAQKTYSDLASDVCDFSSSCTDDPTGYRLALGHSFNEHIALELGYSASGDFKGAGANESLSFEVNSIDLAAVGRLPLTEMFALTGKLGLARAEAETSFSSLLGSATDDRSSTVPIYGVGMELGWFTLGYEVITDTEIGTFIGDPEEDDIERLYAGVKFKF